MNSTSGKTTLVPSVPPPTERVLPRKLDPKKVYRAKTREGRIYTIFNGTYRREDKKPKETKKERIKRRRELSALMKEQHEKID